MLAILVIALPEVPELIPVRVELTVLPAVGVAPVVAQPDIVPSISQDVACVGFQSERIEEFNFNYLF